MYIEAFHIRFRAELCDGKFFFKERFAGSDCTLRSYKKKNGVSIVPTDCLQCTGFLCQFHDFKSPVVAPTA